MKRWRDRSFWYPKVESPLLLFLNARASALLASRWSSALYSYFTGDGRALFLASKGRALFLEWKGLDPFWNGKVDRRGQQIASGLERKLPEFTQIEAEPNREIKLAKLNKE
jgi:hypothetical protein